MLIKYHIKTGVIAENERGRGYWTFPEKLWDKIYGGRRLFAEGGNFVFHLHFTDSVIILFFIR